MWFGSADSCYLNFDFSMLIILHFSLFYFLQIHLANDISMLRMEGSGSKKKRLRPERTFLDRLNKNMQLVRQKKMQKTDGNRCERL